MKRVQKQLAEAVNRLEQTIQGLDPGGKDWPFLFQMLRSFDRFHLQSYREMLLFGIAPTYLLETPYCVEEYVDPPRAQCFKKADFLRYSQPEWLGLTGAALTERLSQNEFGYLHPEDSRSFLGITRQSYDRLYDLYCRCPARCREETDRVVLAMIDFILDVLDGNPGRLTDYIQEKASLP